MLKYSKKTIGELCDIQKGETGIANAVPGKYTLVTTGKERKTCATYQFDTQAVCLPLISSSGHGKKSLNYVHYQEGKFALGNILAAIIPKNNHEILASFLHQYLFFYKDTKIVPLMRGAANVSLSIKDIAKIEVPVPPIDDQKKFILFFNKFQNFHDQLIQEFDNQSNIISQLKQSILQEAISGQLTAEWRSHHPMKKGDPNFDAKALLAKIKTEKEILIAEGKLKKEKPLSEILPDDIPFDLPKSWVWCRLGNLAELITSGSRDWAKYYSKSGAIFLTMSNLSRGSYNLRMENIRYVKPPQTGEGSRTKLESGDLLISITGDVGNLGLIPDNFGDAYINQHTCLLRFISYCRNRYFPEFMRSPFAKKQFDGPQRGIKNSFRLSDVESIIIPLPPLAEQKIIVEKVDQIMKIIDQLEEQVKHRQELAEQLMQTVLQEAFD